MAVTLAEAAPLIPDNLQRGVVEPLPDRCGEGKETLRDAVEALEQGVEVRYDRVPKGEVEVRRSSPVTSADDHHLGHVEGRVVDDEQHVTHVVLERGHLWGKRDVSIPIGAVDRVEAGAVILALSKDEVGELDEVRVHRWRSHAGCAVCSGPASALPSIPAGFIRCAPNR